MTERGLRPGDITPMTSANVLYGDPKAEYMRLSYAAPRSHRMVFMFLGEETRNGSVPLDCEKRLNDLGWFRKES